MKSAIHYSLNDLLARAAELGNHFSKYIFNIRQRFDDLINLLDERGLVDQVHLLRLAPQPRREMQVIVEIIPEAGLRQELLGCYYGLQFLLLDIKALDVLQMKMSTGLDRYQGLRTFLMRTGNDFRRLTAAYMQTLLNLFLSGETRPGFVVCGVGTRVDQDDIDLGIIDTGEAQRMMLTTAFGALNTEMLKYACALHFHLSEHVGTSGYSASVADYHALLDDEIGDFVILSEMVNAVPILGDVNLFADFRNEILSRYYYRHGQDNRYHEGFLRGLLGEIRDLMYKEPLENILNPKRDGLRMLKAILFALKTWKGLAGNTSLEVLDVLLQSNGASLESYHQIFKALTFLESFRFLYQMMVVQEEEVHLDNPGVRANLRPVAQALGYADKSYADAVTQMLTNYYDHHQLARQGIETLLLDSTEHLAAISVFHPITHFNTREAQPVTALNVPMDFIRTSRFFQGVRFWDDLLNSLNNPNQVLLRRFVEDFNRLPSDKQTALIKTFVRWGVGSPYSLITLFTILAHRRPQITETDFYRGFIREFVQGLESTLETVTRISQILRFAPQTLNNFLALLSVELLENIISIFEQPAWKPEIEILKNTTILLCRLYRDSSYYFKRFVQRVFNTYADYLTSLSNQLKLSQLAEGLFHNIDNFDSLEEKTERLGDYYDFEYVRHGISLINGAPFAKVSREFTTFSDNYLQVLFELCREEVARAMNFTAATRDLLALFVAGGHARGQAFDDDYDLIILLNSDDKSMHAFSNRVIQKMNERIIRRSIIPQYRFADRFRYYVTTFTALRNLFAAPDENLYIDQSQLLGARPVVCSLHFQESFLREIVEPYIFARREQFIAALIRDIRQRRQATFAPDVLDLKESPGGLRDYENCLFILKARLAISAPISGELIANICRLLPEQKANLRQLTEGYHLLKHARDLYRLMVSNTDQLQIEHLSQIVKPLTKALEQPITDGKHLCRILQNTLQSNSTLIETLLVQEERLLSANNV